MDGAPRRGGAIGAWGVAVALVGLSVPREAAWAPDACGTPTEIEARDGHSIVVSCGEDPSNAVDSGPGVRGPARLLFGLPLDLTSVDAATLEVLPGVGPVLASEIVRERTVRPVASVADLARVPGIGARRAARLAPWFGEGSE